MTERFASSRSPQGLAHVRHTSRYRLDVKVPARTGVYQLLAMRNQPDGSMRKGLMVLQLAALGQGSYALRQGRVDLEGSLVWQDDQDG